MEIVHFTVDARTQHKQDARAFARRLWVSFTPRLHATGACLVTKSATVWRVVFLSVVAFAVVPARATDNGRQITHVDRVDQLDDANYSAGGADVPVLNGEAVSSFNGNLQITHSSSGVLPGGRGLSIGLTRTYNSVNVRKYGVGGNLYLAGRSWVGLGCAPPAVFRAEAGLYHMVTNKVADWGHARDFFEGSWDVSQTKAGAEFGLWLRCMNGW